MATSFRQSWRNATARTRRSNFSGDQIPYAVGPDGVARSVAGNLTYNQLGRRTIGGAAVLAGGALAARAVYRNRKTIARTARNAASRVRGAVSNIRNRFSGGRGASNAAQV